MQYLIGQMLMCLLAAGLLGLVLGWLLWGTPLRRSRERTAELEQRVSKLSGYPAQLTDLQGTHAAFIASKNEESAKCKARIAELEGALAGKDAAIAGHVAAHADKDARLGTLLSRIAVLEKERQALAAEVQQAKVEPLKARAAAAGLGFYEAGNGAPVRSAPTPPPAAAPELEQRIAELRSAAVSKDAEIAKLSGKLTELEAQPDPDLRRQILLAAKNAELTHLRGILNALFQPAAREEIASRAYSYAERRGFAGGSPTEDWLRAERDCHFARLAYAWESTRSGTMF